MDRICLIKMDYQSEEEERKIVQMRTRIKDPEAVPLAVEMVRATREHADIKLGASIRAAIDMVDIFTGMQKLADQPRKNILTAARMGLSNRIWLNEMTRKTADDIIEEIWSSLRGRYKTFAGNGNGTRGVLSPHANRDNPLDRVQTAKKKINVH
jgi:MoxR-like ATPase